ncbi:hypothetical protein [Profundibacterium mesophilum]|uniref:Yip1 domain-containing protein n=1 Tax=Profundibacterium mesophilum KAUST100406-0324 TaxID=1037889 RepID=A0A921NYM9_9RHOB|nr:hypothetical protein [Profundibacterium mesophilum]KAF0677109.1 hypothetical protein PMES_00423 [Profundibacterium mesophilum KAUST100406-0324]
MAPNRRLPVPLGVPIAGLLWSLATLQARSSEIASLDMSLAEAAFPVTLGGIGLFLALWGGFTGVTWALCRAFGGRLSLLGTGALVSQAALPLWIAAPVAAFWLAGASTAAAPLAALAGLALYGWTLSGLLSTDLDWSLARAGAATASAIIFLVSFVFLTI